MSTYGGKIGVFKPFQGFRLLGRTTLTVAGDVVTVSGLPSTRYLYITASLLQSGAILPQLTFNNDTGLNYSMRRSTDGAADVTAINAANIALRGASSTADQIINAWIINLAANEKQVNSWISNFNAAGAGSIPERSECVGKWVNTTDAINRIDLTNPSAGDFAIGSELLVFGFN